MKFGASGIRDRKGFGAPVSDTLHHRSTSVSLGHIQYVDYNTVVLTSNCSSLCCRVQKIWVHAFGVPVCAYTKPLNKFELQPV